MTMACTTSRTRTTRQRWSSGVHLRLLLIFYCYWVLLATDEVLDAIVTEAVTPSSSTATTNNAGIGRERNERFLQQSCPPCPQCDATTTHAKVGANIDPSDEPLILQVLMFDSPGIITMVDWNARDYEKITGGKVKIEIKLVPTLTQLYEEIEDDALRGGGLFDAYYANPVILGTAATHGGLLDLTPYVKESPYADWTDVLLALRTYVTSFEDKIYLILLDGDTHTMFYRKDVLKEFGLQPPRTWNEYNAVAKAVHGKHFNGTKLSGSCVSRIQGDHAMYWSHLILSTITQSEGTSTGSLFDTKDMMPLTGEAMAEMLRISEEQAKYGTPDEFEEILNHVQNFHMNDGSCVMTFMWGDMFRRSKAEGSVLHDKLGVAPTPGSEVVMNRKTGKLERCTKELCPYAKYYSDIGFVNSAPYAANGGWGAAISSNTSPEKQKALAEFFLWASSRDQSDQYVIPNATLPIFSINGQDPWRKSHLDVDKWVARGFEREVSKQYVESILTNLISKNVVVEARFPKAGEIMAVLDKEVNEHLVRAHNGLIRVEDEHEERLRTAESITHQWNQIIKTHNQRGDTITPILEVYQRLRGVYVPNERKNQLTNVRPVGYTLMAIIIVSALAAMGWVYYKRDDGVIKASQPVFLGLIALGTLVMSLGIVPMSIDDSIAGEEGCNIACMSAPWLIAIGFTLCFAALFSKIWRLNILITSAANFQKIKVTHQDVLVPFAVMLALNFVFLLTWTLVDPLYYQRVSQGRSESGEIQSYGRCVSDGTVSIVMGSLIAAVNIIALLLANFQAYRTRGAKVAYFESHYIALAMASMLQAFLIGLPVLFLVHESPTANYIVRSILVFVVCMAVLGFVFVPKLTAKELPVPSRSASFSSNKSWLSSNLRSSSMVPFDTARRESAVSRESSQQSFGVDSETSSQVSFSAYGNVTNAEKKVLFKDQPKQVTSKGVKKTDLHRLSEKSEEVEDETFEICIRR